MSGMRLIIKLTPADAPSQQAPLTGVNLSIQ